NLPRRVAGETIAGTVKVDAALARAQGIERVQINLKGLLEVYVLRTHTQSSKSDANLVDLKSPLWNGTSPAESPLPFQFCLPTNLPPSFHCDGYRRGASICYSLEVVGTRSGRFVPNLRIETLFSVVSAATTSQMLDKGRLTQSWDGAWRDTKQEVQLRRGILGEYSRAYATVRLY
ncbi:hypothetical protein DFH06DRAFT_927791, partial [Mycena polygramma]